MKLFLVNRLNSEEIEYTDEVAEEVLEHLEIVIDEMPLEQAYMVAHKLGEKLRRVLNESSWGDIDGGEE